tara:strand:+ start:358 stop:699 length:342 start_codon:yes stop_codon:yes gene_type:complete
VRHVRGLQGFLERPDDLFLVRDVADLPRAAARYWGRGGGSVVVVFVVVATRWKRAKEIYLRWTRDDGGRVARGTAVDASALARVTHYFSTQGTLLLDAIVPCRSRAASARRDL